MRSRPLRGFLLDASPAPVPTPAPPAPRAVRHQSLVLSALADGGRTIAELVASTGLTRDQARVVVSCLMIQGRVVRLADRIQPTGVHVGGRRRIAVYGRTS